MLYSIIMVTRCVCFGKKFSELKRLAKKHKVKSLEELQEHVTFGLNCRRCHPYVREMLKTGETVFELIQSED